MEIMTVAIIFGGCSPEYHVSLESAYAVVTHLDVEKLKPVLLGITPEGKWRCFTGNVECLKDDTWRIVDDCYPALIYPDRSSRGLLVLKDDKVETVALDVAFPVLHGRNGEDGTIQGLLELAGIPLVGCSVLSSALCMDKERAHKVVETTGVRVPSSFLLDGVEDEETIQAFAESLGYPLFIKPLRAGSSFGITKVNTAEKLLSAVRLAFEYDNHVILEESISGFEVGCVIMGNDVLTIDELDSIELAEGFFDFEEKYTLKTSTIHVPAPISPAKAKELKEKAQVIYRVLGCRGFARVDMFLTDEGEVVFNEVNTIPGFTAHSRYPSMMKASGISLEHVITKVIELALE